MLQIMTKFHNSTQPPHSESTSYEPPSQVAIKRQEPYKKTAQAFSQAVTSFQVHKTGSANQRADLLTIQGHGERLLVPQVENQQWHVILHTMGNGSAVHHL